MRQKIKERKRRIRKNERQIGNILYWSTCKAAEYLGVSKCTVLSYCKNGLAFLKIGGNFLFQESWLEDYVQERTEMQTYREAK